MDKRVTMKDVAREAGVSSALVSYVLSDHSNGCQTHKVNPETARRILEVSSRLEYRPNSVARTLRIGRTMTIGVILSDIANPFYSEIARYIENKAYEYNYSVIFGSTDENSEKLETLVHVFLNKNVDGMIIVPCEGANAAIRELSDSGLPVVLLDRRDPGDDIPSVSLDNYAAGRKAVEALLKKGRHKIEMVSHGVKLSHMRDREAGYRSAMENAGYGSSISIHSFYYDKLDEVREYIKDAHARGVDAFLCATNTLTGSVLKELFELGYTVPGDFAITAFCQNPAFNIYKTPVSFVQQPINRFGDGAVDMIIRLINKDMSLTEKNLILKPSIISIGI